MLKNSSFIQKKEFHVVFKGYKPEEVDKFLDSIAVELDRLIAKNQELQESLDKLRFELREQDEGEKKQDEDFKKIIQDALVSAHKVAEDIKEKAKKEAQALIDKTENQESEKIRQIRQQKERIGSELSLLTKEYDEIKSKLKQLSQQFNSLLEGMGGLDMEKYSRQQETVEEEEKEPAEEKESESQVPAKDIDPEALVSDEMIKESDIEALKKEEIDHENESGEKQEKKEKTQMEDTDKDQSSPKKEKSKKIDIADPDLIESFFKSEEDQNY